MRAKTKSRDQVGRSCCYLISNPPILCSVIASEAEADAAEARFTADAGSPAVLAPAQARNKGGVLTFLPAHLV